MFTEPRLDIKEGEEAIAYSKKSSQCEVRTSYGRTQVCGVGEEKRKGAHPLVTLPVPARTVASALASRIACHLHRSWGPSGSRRCHIPRNGPAGETHGRAVLICACAAQTQFMESPAYGPWPSFPKPLSRLPRAHSPCDSLLVVQMLSMESCLCLHPSPLSVVYHADPFTLP